MANYVSKLSKEELEKLRPENPSPKQIFEHQTKLNSLVADQAEGWPGIFQRDRNREWTDYEPHHVLKRDAAHMLKNPEGVPEPQLMQAWKFGEQRNREANTKAANYWSQVAENFALGKGPVMMHGSDFPTVPQAPTLSNVSMDSSGQPTPQAPQAPATSDAEELERLRNRERNSLVMSTWAKDPKRLKTYVDTINRSLETEDNWKGERKRQDFINERDGKQGAKYDPETDRFYIPKSHRYYEEPVPGLLNQMFVETPLQMDRSANELVGKIAGKNSPTFNPIGGGFSYGQNTPVPASRTGSETIGGDIATGLTTISEDLATGLAPLTAHSQKVGGFAPQAPANNVASPAGTNESSVTTAQAVVPQAPSIFQSQQTQPMPSQAIGQAPAQANQFSQEAAAQVNPILAPQIDQTFDQAQVNIPPSLQNPFATQASQAPQGNGLTTVSGIPLSDFLSGKALPEQGLMRAENPMYGDNSLSRGLGGDAATQAFQDASAAREARIEQNFSNGRAISDRERRGTGEMSMEAAVRMAGGDRDEARQMIERQRQGRDPVTGEVLKPSGSGVSDKEKAETAKIQAETAKILSGITENVDTSNWTAGQTQAMKTQAKELSEWEINDLPKLENNLASLNAVVKALDEGQIKTGGIGDQIPGLSSWARPFLNPDAEVAQQQVAGVIMQTLKETFPGAISNEERKALISTVYNPQLDPKKNAELVGGYADRLNKAMNAKKQQVAHFRQYGSLESYTGTTPRDALLEGINTGSGSGGSPIEGDVDIQSESDQYYKG